MGDQSPSVVDVEGKEEEGEEAPQTQCHHNMKAPQHSPSRSPHRQKRSASSRRKASRLPRPPLQFVVEKQGRFEEDTWRTRVLTIDAAQHCLYLSKADKAEELLHRCMTRIDSVKFWPFFNSLRIGEDFRSEPATRTVCVKGLVGVKAATFSFATRLLGSTTLAVPGSSVMGRFLSGRLMRKKKNRQSREQEEEESPTLQQPSKTEEIKKSEEAQSSPPTDRKSEPPRRSLSEENRHAAEAHGFADFTTEVWMMRSMTEDDLRQLARALRRATPRSSELKGYHRVMERTKRAAEV